MRDDEKIAQKELESAKNKIVSEFLYRPVDTSTLYMFKGAMENAMNEITYKYDVEFPEYVYWVSTFDHTLYNSELLEYAEVLIENPNFVLASTSTMTREEAITYKEKMEKSTSF